MDTDPIDRLHEARRAAAAALVGPGDWLTGPQRHEAWKEARAADTDELDRARRAAISPYAVAGSHPAGEQLPAAAVDVVHRVASDPGRLSRVWADERIAELGAEVYTELVGVTALARALDTFDIALDGKRAPLPEPVEGEPARVRPEGVGDVGAWVPQTTEKTRANVSRTLSLVPVTDGAWRAVVDSHYSRGAEFFSLAWDRALDRAQVEAVAARTTSELECFY